MNGKMLGVPRRLYIAILFFGVFQSGGDFAAGVIVAGSPGGGDALR
jgi:hypothetical protein